MKGIIAVVLMLVLAGCASSVVAGNSRSVVVNSGTGAFTQDDITAVAKAEADKWCAKYGRVSGTETGRYMGRRKEFECVEK